MAASCGIHSQDPRKGLQNSVQRDVEPIPDLNFWDIMFIKPSGPHRDWGSPGPGIYCNTLETTDGGGEMRKTLQWDELQLTSEP